MVEPCGDLGSKAGVVGDDVVDVVVECGGKDVAVFGVDDRGVYESAGDWLVVELVGAGGEDEVADADRVQHVRVEQDERSGDRWTV